MKTRIYVVTSNEVDEPARLVKAVSPAQAIRHVASKYAAEVASQEQLVEFVGQGAKVETAQGEET